jgi:hypothetical protein
VFAWLQVINFDPPKTALDYVHRAGRVERLGGKQGCTVVTLVKDDRVPRVAKKEFKPELRAIEAAPAAAAASPSTTKPPPRPSTFSGPQVQLMRRVVGQLHLDARHVTVKGGQMEDFVWRHPMAEVGDATQPEATSEVDATVQPAASEPTSFAASSSAAVPLGARGYHSSSRSFAPRTEAKRFQPQSMADYGHFSHPSGLPEKPRIPRWAMIQFALVIVGGVGWVGKALIADKLLTLPVKSVPGPAVAAALGTTTSTSVAATAPAEQSKLKK